MYVQRLNQKLLWPRDKPDSRSPDSRYSNSFSLVKFPGNDRGSKRSRNLLGERHHCGQSLNLSSLGAVPHLGLHYEITIARRLLRGRRHYEISGQVKYGAQLYGAR